MNEWVRLIDREPKFGPGTYFVYVQTLISIARWDGQRFRDHGGVEVDGVTHWHSLMNAHVSMIAPPY